MRRKLSWPFEQIIGSTSDVPAYFTAKVVIPERCTDWNARLLSGSSGPGARFRVFGTLARSFGQELWYRGALDIGSFHRP